MTTEKTYHTHMQSLGRRIASARHDAKLTQSELGTAAGVRQTTVASWEGDHSRPPINRLRLIAAAVHKPVEWFLSEDSPQDDESGNTIPPWAEQVIQAIQANPDAYKGMEWPGIRQLLGNETLCRAIAVTDEERRLLSEGLNWPLGPNTVDEALLLLQAIRALTARRAYIDRDDE